MITSLVVPGEPGGTILFSSSSDGDISLMVRIEDEGPVSICRAAPVFVMLKGGVKGLAWIVTDASTGGRSVADIQGIFSSFMVSLRLAAGNMGVSTDEPFSKRWGSLKKSTVIGFANNVTWTSVGTEFASSVMSAARESSIASLRKAYSMACFLNPFEEVQAAIATSLAEDVLSA